MSERTFVAFRVEARRWAKRVGVPAAIIPGIIRYEERTWFADGRIATKVQGYAYGGREERLWTKGFSPRSQSATFTIARAQGWDKRGPDGQLARGTP